MLGRWDKQLIDQASDFPNIIHFSRFLAKFFAKIVSIYLLLNNFTKIKSFECPKSIRNYEKKYLEHQMLG